MVIFVSFNQVNLFIYTELSASYFSFLKLDITIIAKTQIIKLKTPTQIYKDSLLTFFMRYPVSPIKVPSPNAVAIVKFDPCDGFTFWLNSWERVKQRAKRTEFDKPYIKALKIIPNFGLIK